VWNKRWKFHRTHSFLLDHALMNLCNCLFLSFYFQCARYTCLICSIVIPLPRSWILYLLECKTFSLNLAQIYEVIWNLLLKSWTTPRQSRFLWTTSCRAKPWPALPNHYVRSPLFWDIMQHWKVILYWHFGTICQSHLQGPRNLKERIEHD